jgi:drug/metabolite transporter (DMT)-like permease
MSRRGWLLFAIVGVCWGVPYLLIKVAVRSVSPADLVFGRTVIGAAILLPISAARGELPKLAPFWRPLLLYTVVELMVPWLLLSEAEKRLPSSLSGLLVAAVPFAGAVIGRLTGQPSLGRARLTGLFIGIAGVVVLLGLDLKGAHPWSLVEVGVVVVGYAWGPSIASRKLAGAPSMAVVSASLAITALVYLPWVVTHIPAHAPGLKPVAAIAALGVVCTAIAFVVFFDLIAEVGPSRALVVTYVNPAVAVLLGVTILHEAFGWSAALGFALILAGSYVSTSAAGAAKRGPQPGVAQIVPGAGKEAT